MKKKQSLMLRWASGIVLILIGILCIFNVIRPAQMLATVVYPSTFWVYKYPESMESGNPTMLTPRQTVILTVECVSYDATLDIDMGNDMFWEAKVEIRKLDGTLIGTVDLPTKDFTIGKNVNGHTCNTVAFTGSWTVPNTEGVTYSFKWMVDIYQDSSTFVDKER